ncbi:MAG: ABC transporter permease [Nostocoides sp.]
MTTAPSGSNQAVSHETARAQAVRDDRDHEANFEARERATKSGFLQEVQVYEPHHIGIPPIGPYVRELWSRREFAAELSRAEMRSANTRTFFGQIWLVINPVLLASVYYVLVSILNRNARGMPYLAHLVAGIFAFYYVQGGITTGARSVVGGGALISNIAFPRLLMPLSAIRTSFYRFLPTVPVYFIFHVLAKSPWSWKMLLSIYFLICMTIFSAGLAAIFATLQVYFRDTLSFLPYFLRIWLYLSPVLWFAEDVRASWRPFMVINPLFSILGGWGDLLVRSEMPKLSVFVLAAAWSIGTAVVGFLIFMSRERDFAVRL